MARAKPVELLAVSDSRNEFTEKEATLFLNGANPACLVDECVQVRAVDPIPIGSTRAVIHTLAYE